MAISALQYQKNSISQMPASFRRYIYTKLNPGNKERKKKQGITVKATTKIIKTTFITTLHCTLFKDGASQKLPNLPHYDVHWT